MPTVAGLGNSPEWNPSADEQSGDAGAADFAPSRLPERDGLPSPRSRNGTPTGVESHSEPVRPGERFFEALRAEMPMISAKVAVMYNIPVDVVMAIHDIPETDRAELNRIAADYAKQHMDSAQHLMPMRKACAAVLRGELSADEAKDRFRVWHGYGESIEVLDKLEEWRRSGGHAGADDPSE